MQDRIRQKAEIAYIVLILAVAVIVWRQASALPPAPYDPLGPKSFPIWVSCGLVALAILMLVRLLFGRALGQASHNMVTGLDGDGAYVLSPWTAALTLLLSFAYAAALSLGVPFLPATMVYLFAAGAVLGPFVRRRLLLVAGFAVAAAFALDFLFRIVFQLDLK